MKDNGKTIIVISHDDRYYDLADRLWEIDQGVLKDPGSQVKET